MKTCSKCKETKSLSDYAKRYDDYQPYCKVCASQNATKWYKENKNKKGVKERIYEYEKKARKKFQDKFNEFKEQLGCSICLEKDPCCLDFHHIDGKDKNVSYFVGSKSMKKLSEEIVKCICVCANCHRKIHAKKIIPPKIGIDADEFLKKMTPEGLAPSSFA